MDWDFIRIALALTAAALLLSAGIEDARTREIANRKSVALVLLAPLWWWANGAALWPDAAIQLALALAAFGVFAFAFHLGMMGGGDVKLIAALTLWLPLPLFAGMLVTMSLAGGAVTLVMLAERLWLRRRQGGELPAIEVPYGVAIAIAGMLALREPILNQFG
ncbi:prepilin peptidase [Sphingomonas sp. KR1UV-12]|uniref:Prepilin peptidase n=1 Tax=Sphingomonas aurea TaxID=3063994 RepID=A0ABT9EFP9_9SPHN|nr:prepilin peptidase [Sphingomonas sp. KR1UV-12]MDP1025796.1 prepilin peptidase [Sphingomonas sp. KR1UV-12]